MSGARKKMAGKPCPYCERTMERNHPRLDPMREHTMPQSKGGREIIIVCIQCNMIKADMLPEQWGAFMAAHPGWWKLTKHELRAIRRKVATPGLEAHRNDRREKKARKAQAVVVPPELIWARADLIQQTVELDAHLRLNTPAEPEPQPSQSDEACPR